MRIESIEALPVRAPRDVERTTGTAGLPSRLESSQWNYRWSEAFPTLYAVHFETALIKITTDTGLAGWGEAHHEPTFAACQRSVWNATMNRHSAPNVGNAPVSRPKPVSR